ncbi:cyclin-like protein [Entophlyctis helioformis]|nr:cyclin-like protein [Entophlyctis helioformis]
MAGLVAGQYVKSEALGLAASVGGIVGIDGAGVKPKQLHEQVSQFRHWQFTAAELEARREQVNAEGVSRARKAIELEAELSGADTTGEQQAASPQFLTWQEQMQICRFYEGKIMDFCQFFGFDKVVRATAIAFFKRFYLNKTVMDYDPKVILITCLFLSTKVENAMIPLSDFLAKIPKSPEANLMVDLEFELSKGLNFEFAVHHPYWPLHGLFLDMQTFIQATQQRNKQAELIRKLYAAYNQATDLINSLLITDAIFLYMPSQIALGALKEASIAAGIAPTLDAYLSDRFQTESPETLAGLTAKIESVQATIKGASSAVVGKAEAAAVSAKLKTSMNPEFLPQSRVFKKRALEMEELAQQKKKRKADGNRQYMESIASVLE